MDYEENYNNPSLNNEINIKIKHYFIIKYKTEEIKKELVDIVLRLVKHHEIADFYIEEKKAFSKNRIIYNFHTIFIYDETNKERNNFKKIEEEFLKVLK